MAEENLEGEEKTSSEESQEESKEESQEESKEESKEESEEESKEESKEDDEGDDDDEPKGAPEAYEDFKIADGFEVPDERLATFQEFGKTNNLTQEAAQELVDLHVASFDEFTQGQQDAWDTLKADWAKEAQKDKALQGEDGKADAAIALAAKAVQTIGGEELAKAFDLTGAGDHPAVVRAFHELGKRIAEDQLVFDASGEDTRTAAQKLYPTMNRKK